MLCLLVLSFLVIAKIPDTPVTNFERQSEVLKLLMQQDNIDSSQRDYYQQELHLLYESKQLKSQQFIKGPAGTAVINGTITNTSALAIENHNLVLYKFESGQKMSISSIFTDASGNYSFTDLASGIYAVQSGNRLDDYLDYVWRETIDGGPLLCSGCTFPIESQFNLADAAVKNNVDFSIPLGGVINGNLSDATTMDPVSSFIMNIPRVDGDSSYRLFASIDTMTGNFSVKGMPDGDYRVFLQRSFEIVNNHIPQVYGGFECNACFRLTTEGIGTIISIASANIVNNIDFALNLGASISGRVVDAISLNSLADLAFVMIFDELNQNLASFFMEGSNNDPMATGSYTIGGLLPGSYYVQGGDLGREFYQRELYANKPCYWSGCNRGVDGDAVVLSALETRIGINFLLEVGGKISGTVTDNATGLPITLPDFRNLWVNFYDVNEAVTGGAFVGSNGVYTSARGMPAGDYAVRTGLMFSGDLSAPYVNEKYNDIACPGVACDLSTQDVNITANNITGNIDFALTIGHSFAGTITDTATALPIADVNVLVYKDMGSGIEPKFANWATTSDGSSTPTGSFVVSGLPAGTYYAVTNNGSNLPFPGLFPKAGAGWIDILYNNMPCPAAGCDISSGTAIVLPATVRGVTAPNIDFSLSQGASISGKVTNFNDSAAIKQIEVNVFDDQGNSMGSFTTDNNGEYHTAGFPAGTYYLTTTSFEVLVDVKYGNDICSVGDCNPLDAQPIILSEQQSIDNIDFVLKPNLLFGNGFD